MSQFESQIVGNMQKELEISILASQLSVQNLWSHHYYNTIQDFFCTSKTNSGPPFFDMERLVVVNHRWQSKNTDGSTGVSAPSIYLSDCLFD